MYVASLAFSAFELSVGFWYAGLDHGRVDGCDLQMAHSCTISSELGLSLLMFIANDL